MTRRDDREYREYLREEQRSQPGAPTTRTVRRGVERGCIAGRMQLEFHYGLLSLKPPAGLLCAHCDDYGIRRILHVELGSVNLLNRQPLQEGSRAIDIAVRLNREVGITEHVGKQAKRGVRHERPAPRRGRIAA